MKPPGLIVAGVAILVGCHGSGELLCAPPKDPGARAPLKSATISEVAVFDGGSATLRDSVSLSARALGIDKTDGKLTLLVSVSNMTSTDLVLESGHEARDWIVSYAIGGRTLDVGASRAVSDRRGEGATVCPSPEYTIVLHGGSSISRMQEVDVGAIESPVRGTLRVKLAEYPANLKCGPATFVMKTVDITF